MKWKGRPSAATLDRPDTAAHHDFTYSTCRNRRLRESADTGMSDLHKRLNCSCSAQTCNCKLYRRGPFLKENPLKNSTNSIVLLALALLEWHMGKTAYYSKINPDSPHYDPHLPKAFRLGSAPNSPRAFTRAEVDDYTQILIQRGKEAMSRDLALAATERAHHMVAARRKRQASNNTQARG